MPAPTGLTLEERQEIDAFYEKIRSKTHYELLGIERSADPESIQQAFRARTRRFHPESFSGQIPGTYQERLEAILAALDGAHAVLSDPLRRYSYDDELARRVASSSADFSKRTPPSVFGKRTPAPYTAPVEMKRTPAPHPGNLESTRGHASYTASPEAKRTPPPGTLTPPPVAPRPAVSPTSITRPEGAAREGFNVAPSDPLAPLNPGPRAPTPPPFERAPIKQTGGFATRPAGTESSPRTPRLATPSYGSRPAGVSAIPPTGVGAPDDAAVPDPRVQVLEARVATLQSEVTTLLSEVERLAVSVQLTIAYSLEPGGMKPDQLVNAGQALVATRVTMATLLARREEQAGRWEAAAALWQRASRARPGEVMLLVRAADALRKAGTDFAAAEALAKQAIALDPDCAEAHASLAVIETRRQASVNPL